MRFHPDDERLWTGNVVIEAGSEWKGDRAGAQAVESERLNPTFLLLRAYKSLPVNSDFCKLLI